MENKIFNLEQQMVTLPAPKQVSPMVSGTGIKCMFPAFSSDSQSCIYKAQSGREDRYERGHLCFGAVIPKEG